MSENNNNTSTNITPKEAADAMENLLNETAEQESSKKLTMDYLLGKLEEITLNQEFLTDAISELGKIKSGGPGDVGVQEQARAIGEIVKAREATNQRLIALYEKMYRDLSASEAQKNTPQQQIVNEMIQIIKSESTDPEHRKVAFELLTVCMYGK